ncbi:hypothetical protein OOU_Y34scaffold00676g7 [Pyricularia oryzae Y34]|uniref:Vegetative cell wall protein gp1 n=1 Tax=Pyricularia oryzae (strain Y34) TaxID=1143189 RepID=A0AA97PIK7_PYRO3|nr:hypothetical protein OOU_Y34scaffold00676g7 [Pyricularia oryzae Y34]
MSRHIHAAPALPTFYNGSGHHDSANRSIYQPLEIPKLHRASHNRHASVSTSQIPKTTPGTTHKQPKKFSSKRHEPFSPQAPSTRNQSSSKKNCHNNYAPAPSRYQSVPTGPEPRRSSHSRRPSVSTPLRPQTTASGSSYGHKISSSKHNEPYSRPQAPPPPPEYKNRKATREDAKRLQIPEGCSLLHWDPEETPFILAGSVFDANSLGKWIYDWVAYVYRRPEGNEMKKIAGELWLLLIQISGKVKRAIEVKANCILEDREMLEGFIESGRDYELANTEKFMASARLWNLRFDSNCEDIILAQTNE